MRYVLDTDIVSELMKGNPRALSRLRAAGRTDAAIPQPVIAEIAYGLERLPRSKRRTQLEQRFDLLRSELPRCQWTDTVSERFGACKAKLERKGQRIEDFDVAIVAHALAVGATLITADRGDMLRFDDLKVEDWTAEGED
jgi:tRNA(fMet)-specific endonuclease VapC